MKFNGLTKSAALIMAFMGTQASALTAVPTPDPYPFQSQMMVRQGDGTIQTLPAFTTNYKIKIPGVLEPRVMNDSAMLYEMDTPYTGVSSMGANWSFFQSGEGDSFATIEASGKLWPWGVQNFKPALKGGVYFLKAGNMELVTVNSAALFWETKTYYGMPRLTGGNFFIDEDNTLVYILSDGRKFEFAKSKEVAKARRAGGNFFETADGTIMGVRSTDGFVTSYKPESPAKWLGGNYFIGNDNTLYTISNFGVLKRNPDITFTARPVTMAYSLLKNADGSFVYVDGTGMPHASVVHLSITGAEAVPQIEFANPFDQKMNFTPGMIRR